MNERWRTVYQPPASPLARVAMVLVGAGVVALSFVLGLFALTIALGMAVIGAITLAVRRLLAARSGPAEKAGPLEVEYRVIHRERRRED